MIPALVLHLFNGDTIFASEVSFDGNYVYFVRYGARNQDNIHRTVINKITSTVLEPLGEVVCPACEAIYSPELNDCPQCQYATPRHSKFHVHPALQA